MSIWRSKHTYTQTTTYYNYIINLNQKLRMKSWFQDVSLTTINIYLSNPSNSYVQQYAYSIMYMIIQMNKIMKNTIVASCIAIVNESWSSLAATIRQGTWKPVSSPWPAIFDKSSDDAFREESDLQLIFSQLAWALYNQHFCRHLV